MKIIPVKSSAMTKIGYDGNNLFIKFIKTDWYRFPDVPETLFDEFSNAQSKGKFFHEHIRPNFDGKPCPNPEL